MTLKSFISSLFLFAFIFSQAQTRRFSHLTYKDGISQSEIYSFLEDSRGFMWFGTVDGLNRYDGNKIEIFNTQKNDPHSLSNNTIRSLTEDHLGRIWIGTDDGLNVYDSNTELFYQVEINSLNNNSLQVWTLLVKDGFLLMGTNKGLWRTNIQGIKLKEIGAGFQQVRNLENPNITIKSLTESKNGGIWILNMSGDITRIVFQNMDINPVIIEHVSFYDLAPAVAFAEDQTGNIWITFSRNGLLRYNPETEKIDHFLNYGTHSGPASNKCSAITTDKSGNLWVATIDKGLNFIKATELEKEQVSFESIQNQPFYSFSLNSNLIFSLYVSKDNHLWVGTIGSGINILNSNQKKFTHYKFRDLSSTSPNSNFIRSVYVDNQNRIWTGAHNNGLFLFDRKSEKFHKLGFETQSVFYIANYEGNKKFICTSSGFYLVELINNKINILSESSTNQHAAAFNITKSEPDVYWLATISGLFRVKVINDKLILTNKYTSTTTPGISNNNCRVLFFDEDNNELLVGTEGGGLNILTLDDEHYPQKSRVLTKTVGASSISNNYIRSIIKDKDKNIWVGTYEGLNRMIRDTSDRGISFQSFTKKDGLPNNMIQLLVEDDNNCLWIGTNGGLSQFRRNEGRFINYTPSDGIQSTEFSEHTVYKKDDGEIVVGGINGINAFYPRQIEVDSLKAQVAVTDFYLFNDKVNPLEKVGRKVPLQKSIVLTDTIKLLSKQNNFGFDFSAMIYPNAENVQFAYMLEGFDENWNYTDAQNRNANYTNLRHGKYLFKVKSTNNDGVWEEEAKEIFIHIKTPFIYTWYAFIIYGLGIILIFVYFSYYSVIRYTTKKSLLLEKEHGDKLHELDVLRTKFFINISHDLRTPLTLIRGPLESMLQSKNLSNDFKEKMNLIKRNVKRLNYLVEQLLDVRKAESGTLVPKLKSEDIVKFTKNEVNHFNYAIQKKGLDLKINSISDNLLACFDSSMISKVYFNVISNSIKFTDKGEINITIKRLEKSKLDLLKKSSFESFVGIEISDTGKGIANDQKSKIFDRFYQNRKSEGGKGYGIGLSHSKEIIDAHNGFIEVESKEGLGTTIRFFLPDIKDIPKSEVKKSFSTEDIYINNESEVLLEPITEEGNSKKILIVEDNADMRFFIKSELKSEFQVLEAQDGIEGIKQAKSKMPDIIVSDIMMPNMDGIEFCQQIKSNLKTSHIPLILLTAKVDIATKYEGIEIGADDYIPKPFEMGYLKIRIKNLLQSREKLRMLFQNNPVLEPSKVTVTSLDEKFLSSLMNAIEAGIPDSEFTVNSLESKMGMSHTSFYRKAKSLTGQSGNELLQNMRMKRAYQVLSETKEIRVDEVAYMVGFNSPKYFSKCFKDIYGILPSEIKKK